MFSYFGNPQDKPQDDPQDVSVQGADFHQHDLVDVLANSNALFRRYLSVRPLVGLFICPSWPSVSWFFCSLKEQMDRRTDEQTNDGAETKHSTSMQTARPLKSLAVRIEFKCSSIHYARFQNLPNVFNILLFAMFDNTEFSPNLMSPCPFTFPAFCQLSFFSILRHFTIQDSLS